MKMINKLTVLLVGVFLCLMSQSALAVDEEPAYQNPAQASHAANLAEAAATEPDPATQDAADSLQQARDAYDNTPTEQTLADLEAARQSYADAIANRTGELSDDIYDMRVTQGMGWGDIAHSLGVHPGSLGLGHAKKKGLVDPADGEVGDTSGGNSIAKATKRDKEFTQKEKNNNSQKSASSKSSNKSNNKGNSGNSKGNSSGGKSNNGNGGGKGKNK